MAEPIQAIGTFGVRNDKYRGLLIESLQSPDLNIHFFKYQDQPIDRHCEQMQRIVRTANVKRVKKITVDMASFLYEYYRPSDDTFLFKASKLKSTNDQVQKVQEMAINKEVGLIKRMNTIADNKQAKIDEKNKKFLAKVAKDEQSFQQERARRIHELTMERQRGTSSSSMDAES